MGGDGGTGVVRFSDERVSGRSQSGFHRRTRERFAFVEAVVSSSGRGFRARDLRNGSEAALSGRPDSRQSSRQKLDGKLGRKNVNAEGETVYNPYKLKNGATMGDTERNKGRLQDYTEERPGRRVFPHRRLSLAPLGSKTTRVQRREGIFVWSGSGPRERRWIRVTRGINSDRSMGLPWTISRRTAFNR